MWSLKACKGSWSQKLKIFTIACHWQQRLKLKDSRPSHLSHFSSIPRLMLCLRDLPIKRAVKSNHDLKSFLKPTQAFKTLLEIECIDCQPYSTHHNHDESLVWKRTSEILEDICKNIVFLDDHIIVFNKAAGLSVHGSPFNTGDTENVTVHGVLPELGKKLQAPHLDIGLSLKSFYSGLVVLCRDTQSKKKLESCLRGSATQKAQIFTYLVITVGHPNCCFDQECSALISRDFIHGREMSVIQEKNNNSARKVGNMMLTCFNARSLKMNDDLGVSLVEISINKDKWEAVETLMSYHLSPVLGDNIYSSRTMHVMGVPFRAAACSVQPCQQILSQSLKQALEDFEPTWKDQPGSIPLYMHRHKLKLNRFPNKSSKSLVIKAPPPQHFVSLLKYLDLYTDEIVDR